MGKGFYTFSDRKAAAGWVDEDVVSGPCVRPFVPATLGIGHSRKPFLWQRPKPMSVTKLVVVAGAEAPIITM